MTAVASAAGAFAAALLGLGCMACAAAPAASARSAALKLHVPSPDWRDQIIYFALTDRFADGDARNNDQGAGEYKPGERNRYNGGDLEGLRQHLRYIQGLGATALWITPPVANQWLDPAGGTAGYHGYWAENFMQVDRHLGTLADYRRLSDALHRSGMFLVQDIVVNHTGDYFAYPQGWDAADPARGWQGHVGSPPVPRPSQPPFDRNDPRDPAQRQAGIYHWTPDVADYNDPAQEHNFQMSGLDDLNTENPEVRRALRRSYGYWIREVGVDAFRVDTAFYVPPEYFADFLRAQDADAPGIAEVARRTGRRQFHVFGEGFGFDRPGQDRQVRKIESYMTSPQGRPLLPGMLNFPLYGALGDAFARGRPAAELGAAITRMMRVHARPHLMPSFIDNHDVDRFLAAGSVAGLKQALLAIMTLPGIPVIYYGTEQGYTEPRAAMFKAGFGSGGRDRYDTSSPLYGAIARMSALRRSQRLFSRGVPTVLQANAAQPGALAWRTDHEGQSALVVFNTAAAETLLAHLETGLPEGTLLQGLYGLDGRPADLVAGPGGRVTLRLPAHCGWVWKAGPRRRPPAAATVAVTLDALAEGGASDLQASGSASGAQQLLLVVDGDLSSATRLTPGADGRWQARVDTGRMIDPEIRHSLNAWVPGQAVSETRSFQVRREWQQAVDIADPPGDDTGPTGGYTYPSEGGWIGHHLADLRRIRAFTSGGALRLELTMDGLSTIWNPPNGFDHVVFTVFFELPGAEGGATLMPLQNAQLPAGMRWHLRLRAGGWTHALFSAAGASATQEGTAVTPAPAIAVDAATSTVSFTFSASAFGGRKSLSGTKIYVTTWDYDSGYRALAPAAQPYVFGGGPAAGARVMDDSAVIVLP